MNISQISGLKKKINNLKTNPFHAIYLIDGNSGCDLISINYTSNSFDVDVISGMFKALEMFINHIAYSNNLERLQEVNFQGIRIVFERYGTVHNHVLCVGVSKKFENLKKEHIILKNIVKDFYIKYEPHIKYFKGDINPFKSFKHKLNRLDLSFNSDSDSDSDSDSNSNSNSNYNYNYVESNSSQISKFPKFKGFQQISE